MDHIRIRAMTAADLPFAAESTAREGWSTETLGEFEAYFDHDPDGCLIAERERRAAGIGVATSFGESGYVGQLVVLPELRGQGVGRMLLDAAVDHLRQCGARRIFLDGVVGAITLYERAGFRRLCRSLRFTCEKLSSSSENVIPMRPADLTDILLADRRAFGADRSFFLIRRLETSPHLCAVQRSPNGHLVGYRFGRESKEVVAVGPVGVLPGCTDPAALLTSFAPIVGDRVLSAGVLETNEEAIRLLVSLGFEPRPEPPWRMVLGDGPCLGESQRLYTIASAAKG